MRTYGMHGSPIEYLTSQGNSSSSATTDAMSDFMRNEFDLAINVNEVRACGDTLAAFNAV